jgi:hypothetical protein
MDPKLNLELVETREARVRSRHEWPDDGLPARLPERARTRTDDLHPVAVVASLLTRR